MRHLVFGLLPFVLVAAPTRYWTVDGRAGFLAGKVHQAAITADGRVELAPALERICATGEQQVWALAVTPDGALYAATGTEGRLFRIRGAEAELIYDSPESVLQCLAVGPDGMLYAGSAPGGLVYRVDRAGTATEFFRTGASYVWAVGFDARGALYVATGNPGQVWRVDRNGRGEVVLASGEQHVIALAFSGSALYAGTARRGLLWRVDERGSRVVYDAGDAEVWTITTGPDRSIFFAANPDYDSSQAPAGARVYRLDADGVVALAWRASDSLVMGLRPGADRLLAGTGGKGRIYELTADGDATLLGEVDESEVTCFAPGARRLVGTAGTGAIYELSPTRAREGTIESDVLDATTITRWGSLEHEADPGGGSIGFDTRSGERRTPDETWSRWQAVSDGRVVSPAARFLQWRATLRAGPGGRGPRLDYVRVAMAQTNLAPRVLSVTVTPVSTAGQHSSQATVAWTAVDPNADSLEYAVSFRALGEESWLLLEDGIREASYTLETQALPDGRYVVRVRASDRPDQGPDRALARELVSEIFTVDNTPPVISGLAATRRGARWQASFDAEDRTSNLMRARYSVNAGPWQEVLPADAMFDSRRESFRFDVAAPSGEAVLVVQAFDENANVTAARVRLNTP